MSLSRLVLLGSTVAAATVAAGGVSLTAFAGTGTTAAAAEFSEPGDVVGKVTVGCQGWFTAAGDGGPLKGWWHYGQGNAAEPVVGIWGFGFNDANHPWTVAACLDVITWFQAQGVYVMFAIVDAGGGLVALRSTRTGKYVCAEQAGAAPLTADHDTVGGWDVLSAGQSRTVTGRREGASINATLAMVTTANNPTSACRAAGTSTKKAGSAVTTEMIRAPAATRTAPRRPVRQAITTAITVITPSTASISRMAYGGPSWPSGVGWNGALTSSSPSRKAMISPALLSLVSCMGDTPESDEHR
ncbi:hypothetical protein [Actinoplanes sp. M2I2]|uniref:fascin domain-containing protein n=1 Tax=Actinoplanes sp. M2I2 TaxID=1734444 RepID=UPI00201FD760|nr:hypothetical protein [Actinoplanes sp. M2I2]